MPHSLAWNSGLAARTILIAFLFSSFAAAELPSGTGSNALRDYVHTPDPAYAWKIIKTQEQKNLKSVLIHLTSQSWRTEKDVNRVIWEHWLTVIYPTHKPPKTGFVFIGGGSNDSGPPDKIDERTLAIAEATSSVVAELRMVPNQPLVFHGDGVPRKEDDLIGYAWDQFLKTGDVTWLPRLPMVKSVVRAMDCIQEVMQSPEQGHRVIEKFVIAGGSKRGWTTWMTGAADDRIAAIIPIVIDVVNVEQSMRHHAEVYGYFTEAIGNYVEHGITKRWTDPRMDSIYRVVDPIYHVNRLQMPKLIVNAAGDEFFCPDSSQFYFNELRGEKYLRYVPNADHSLKGSDAVETLAAFYQTVLEDMPRPKFHWEMGSDGKLVVKAKDRPRRVLLWQATNPKARDFRLEKIGPAYQSQELTPAEDGVFTAKLTAPPEGWTASFVELTFDNGGKLPLKLTTEVKVLPNTCPHAGINPDEAPYELEVAK